MRTSETTRRHQHHPEMPFYRKMLYSNNYLQSHHQPRLWRPMEETRWPHQKQPRTPKTNVTASGLVIDEPLKARTRSPESVQLRDLLETALRQDSLESGCAAELQRINEETAAWFHILNENQLAAQQEATKANTELKLFSFSLTVCRRRSRRPGQC